MDDTTRGTIMRMIKTELEKSIRDRVEWIEGGAFADDRNFPLGYVLGILEEKALGLCTGMYAYTSEQKREYHKEAREMVNDMIPKIDARIRTEQHI